MVYYNAIGIGIVYTTPIICGMNWFPNNKGFVNGLIICGFGMSPIWIDIIMTRFMNPNNIIINQEYGFINELNVINNIPISFIYLSIIYISIQIIACLCISHPNSINNNTNDINKIYDNSNSYLNKLDKQTNTANTPNSLRGSFFNWNNTLKSEYDTIKDENERKNNSNKLITFETTNKSIDYNSNNIDNENSTLLNKNNGKFSWSIIKLNSYLFYEWQFWNLYITLILTGTCIAYIASQWKIVTINILNINNDYLLASMGSISSICNGISRIFWGIIYDKCLGYKYTMLIITITSTILIFLWSYLDNILLINNNSNNNDDGSSSIVIDIIGFIWLCLLNFFIMGTKVIYPTKICNLFGNVYFGINYGLLFTGFIFSGILGILIINIVRTQFGYIIMNNTMGFIQLTSVIFVLISGNKLYTNKAKNMKDLYKKNIDKHYTSRILRFGSIA